MDIGGFFNNLSAPLGIKLFSGGPYADAGIGDQEQSNVQDFLKQLAPIIAQISQNAGVTNPQTGQGGPPGGDPYGLSPLQQADLNQQQSIDEASYNQMLSQIKANLTARGMGDSSTMTAAETYLKQQLSTQLGGERIQAGQNAFQNRNQALQQISQLLGQGYGAKQQVAEGQKATAIKSHEDSMKQLGSLLALGLYAGGVGPFGAAAAGGFAGAGGASPGGNPYGSSQYDEAGGRPAPNPLVGVDWSKIGSIFGAH